MIYSAWEWRIVSTVSLIAPEPDGDKLDFASNGNVPERRTF